MKKIKKLLMLFFVLSICSFMISCKKEETNEIKEKTSNVDEILDLSKQYRHDISKDQQQNELCRKYRENGLDFKESRFRIGRWACNINGYDVYFAFSFKIYDRLRTNRPDYSIYIYPILQNVIIRDGENIYYIYEALNMNLITYKDVQKLNALAMSSYEMTRNLIVDDGDTSKYMLDWW